MRFKPKAYLRWWQIRPIEFGLFLFPLIVQRALVLPLWIMAMTYSESDDIPMSLALDVTYAGWHAPDTLKQIILLGWALLGLAIISAALERCYKWVKALLLFAILIVLMGVMTLNTLDLYEPYLAVRR